MFKPAWVIMGPKESWQAAFKERGIWGVRPLLYTEWKAMDPGDRIFFYVTKTVRGFIGTGRVASKFVQNKPFWPDEIKEGQVIYPYRFEFDIDYLIEEDKWYENRVSGKDAPLRIQEMRRGINLLLPETLNKLMAVFRNRFNCDLGAIEKNVASFLTEEKETETITTGHSALQELIHQIGKMNRLISEKEYPMESERLDVVWRRVEKSVPTYVFEVQVSGDVYHALGKLKHAFEIWNSNIHIVASEEDLTKVDDLLDGTFREIKDKIKKLSIKTINELHGQKKRWFDLERGIGLL
jgi:hypothetical protein